MAVRGRAGPKRTVLWHGPGPRTDQECSDPSLIKLVRTTPGAADVVQGVAEVVGWRGLRRRIRRRGSAWWPLWLSASTRADPFLAAAALLTCKPPNTATAGSITWSAAFTRRPGSSAAPQAAKPRRDGLLASTGNFRCSGIDLKLTWKCRRHPTVTVNGPVTSANTGSRCPSGQCISVAIAQGNAMKAAIVFPGTAAWGRLVVSRLAPSRPGSPCRTKRFRSFRRRYA
jgi:hypothetical protein